MHGWRRRGRRPGVQAQGEAVVQRAGGRRGRNQGLIVRGVGRCGKDHVVHLGGHLHRREVADRLGILRAVEVERPQGLDRTVIEVDVDERRIIARPQGCDGIAEDKQLVQRVRIPHLKDMREDPAQEVGEQPGPSQDQQGMPALAAFSGAQCSGSCYRRSVPGLPPQNSPDPLSRAPCRQYGPGVPQPWRRGHPAGGHEFPRGCGA